MYGTIYDVLRDQAVVVERDPQTGQRILRADKSTQLHEVDTSRLSSIDYSELQASQSLIDMCTGCGFPRGYSAADTGGNRIQFRRHAQLPAQTYQSHSRAAHNRRAH